MHHPYDLGSYFNEISAGCSESRTWLNRGLMWIYCFDLEMAFRCFTQSATLNPDCAMAYWGKAYSSGIYYNKPWDRMQTDELAEKLHQTYQYSREAKRKLPFAADWESMMIEALQARYQSPTKVEPSEFCRWNDEYADQMRSVYESHRENDHVCALFAEALMTRTPWALWELRSGQPAQGASTEEAIDVLEQAMARIENDGRTPHPGILHLYIHVMEMSPFPERALRASDQLRALVPDSGHLCHMPSHIDVRCGHYHEAILANNRAIRADRKYLEHEDPLTFQALSRVHNQHLKIYAAMFLGQFHTALEESGQLIRNIPEALLQIENPAMADWAEGYVGVKAHVLIRFGRWQDIIDHPLPDNPSLYSMTTAVWLYAQAVAYAVKGDIEAATAGQRRFRAAWEKVQPTRYLFNNTCRDVLKIADQMLSGELEYRKGNYETAFDHLQNAVHLDDNLKYDEPWGWMQPARHALGALLLEQGRVDQARQVYEDDLGISDTLVSTSHRVENLWSLHGLVECLERQGKKREARIFRSRLNLAMARADVPIKASCACRLEHQCCDQ